MQKQSSFINKPFLLVVIVLLLSGYALYQRSSFQKERMIYLAQISDAQKAREALEAKIRAAEGVINLLHQGIAGLKQAIDNKSKEAEEFEKQAVLAQNDVQNTKAELQKTKITIDALNSELNRVKSDKLALEKQNAQINKILQGADKKLAAAKEKSEDLKSKLTNMRSVEVLPLKKNLKELKKTLKKKDEEFTALSEKLDSITEEYAALQANNESLLKRLEQLNSERAALQEQFKNTSEQLKQQSESIPVLINTMNGLNEALAKKEGERKALEAKLSEADRVMASQEAKSTENTQRIKDLENESAHLKQQNAQMSTILAQKEMQIDDWVKQAMSSKDEINALKIKSESLEKELVAAGDRQRKVAADFNELVKLNSTLQVRLSEISQSIGQGDSDKMKSEELKRKIEVLLEPKVP